MTAADDHAPLPAHAEALLDVLEHVGRYLQHGDAEHMQHREFAERASLLADHLRAAILLSDHKRYAPAFAVVRTGLEHHLIDRLLFLATRYLQLYGVAKDKVQAEEARLAALKAGPRPDIVRWFMREGKMNVIVGGIFQTGRVNKPPILSPYYVVVERYDPFTGRSRQQGKLAGGFLPVKDRRNAADEAKSLWDSLFVFGKLLRNLRLNRLVTVAQALRLDVHYSFLSAYTHPMGQAYDLVYGSRWQRNTGQFNHAASELVLLYVITLACEELTVIEQMTRREPKVGLGGWSAVAELIEAARRDTAYFWFLHGEAQLYDRVEEAHTRLFRRRQPWTVTPPDPASIAESSVKYYVNPLERLTKLHTGAVEYTSNLGYQPLFR